MLRAPQSAAAEEEEQRRGRKHRRNGKPADSVDIRSVQGFRRLHLVKVQGIVVPQQL
jgi:hypothetical protein